MPSISAAGENEWIQDQSDNNRNLYGLQAHKGYQL